MCLVMKNCGKNRAKYVECCGILWKTLQKNNKSKIESKIKKIYVDFSSNTHEEYKYMRDHESELSEEIKFNIKNNYNDYVKTFEHLKIEDVEEAKKVCR